MLYIKLIFVGFLYLCFSCKDQEKKIVESEKFDKTTLNDLPIENEGIKKDNIDKKMKYLNYPLPKKKWIYTDTATYEGFIKFWEVFYTKLSNRENLIGLVNDEFCTRASSDLDSVFCFNDSIFIDVFQHYLIKDRGYSEYSSLYPEYLMSMFSSAGCTITDDWCRFGDLTFTLYNGEWKLNFVYSTYMNENSSY